MEHKTTRFFYDGVIIVQTPHDKETDKASVVIKEEGIGGLYYTDTFDKWQTESELKFLVDVVRFVIPPKAVSE